jgi:hypothetical protein
LRDVLPDLVNVLRTDLRKIGERSLAEQIKDLRIYGRCCDGRPCGRFYCLPKAERQELHRRKQTRNVGMEFVVANGEILEVETLSSEVDRTLRFIFPEPEED